MAGATALGSCSTTHDSASGSGPPSLSSVVAGRFSSPVQLDKGGLVVLPAGHSTPHVSEKAAEAMFRAADVVDGAYRFSVLGLGVATVRARAETGPAGPGTASSSTTAGTDGSTSSTNGSTIGGAPARAPLPRYDARLAWVGIVWGVGCPGSGAGSRGAARYVAVLFDAETGGSALSYTSRSAPTCAAPVRPAGTGRPAELESVPWELVGPATTAVRVTVPACGTYYGWTAVAGAGVDAVEVVARVPYHPACGSDAPTSEAIDDVVPLGATQAKTPHAALGPVDGLQTLSGA
jgi:hypothetical protein